MLQDARPATSTVSLREWIPRGRALPRWAGARYHWGFLVIFGFATIVRIGAVVAYRPALFFSDSWVYVSMAYTHTPVGIMPSRPSGYPLLLRILTAPGRDVLMVSTAQHLAGLVVGALVYLMMLRLGQRRLIAAAAAAVALLSSYTIALEEFIMAEALFTVLLIGAIVLTVLRRHSPKALLLAGALLAVSCTVRTSALFVIPVWLIYLLWTARDRRRLLCAVAGVTLPLLAYGTWHAVRTDGSFNLDQSSGWFLYGRIAQIADCQGAAVPPATRQLCNVPIQIRNEYPPGDWIWDPGSPAQELTGGSPDFWQGRHGGQAHTTRDDKLLEQFALSIIRAHPLTYLSAAGGDFIKFFNPNVSPYTSADGVTVQFPTAPLWGWVYGTQQKKYLPHYRPRLFWPSRLLLEYQKLCPDPRLLLGVLSIIAALALLAPALSFGRLRVERRAEIFLLTGSGIAMLLASALFVAFVVRYLIPAVPLLMSGGLLAANELLRAAQAQRELHLLDSSEPATQDARTMA